MSPRTPLILSAAAMLAMTGCTVAGDDAPGASPSASSPSPEAAASPSEDARTAATFIDIPDLVREVAPSTVSIIIVAQRNGRTVQGAGSGVIWSEDGVIATNAHVVRGATEIEVALANGERFDGQVIAADPRTDLAAIRIDREGLPAATFAETLPTVGELAVALGNPLGFENTATAGIVSGVERSLPIQEGGAALVGLIQTDAAISSGNSGGALIDGMGQVMGINVAALGGLPTGVAENVGFAIPAPTVTAVVSQLVETGSVAHPYLGIGGATLTPQVVQRFGLEVDRGVIVRAVEPGGPADRSGIEVGDVITALDGTDLASLGDLLAALRQHQPGDTVSVTISRGGQEQTTEVRLGELPEQPAFSPSAPSPGG